MALYEMIMPAMGESIIEVTALKWLKNVGDTVAEDDILLEVATDKVDSEVPSEVSGTIHEIHFKEDDIIPIGAVIATIQTEKEESTGTKPSEEAEVINEAKRPIVDSIEPSSTTFVNEVTPNQLEPSTKSDRFLSPLVRNIAKAEGISIAELQTISGTGMNGRLTKIDLMNYIESNQTLNQPEKIVQKPPVVTSVEPDLSKLGNVEVVKMDRMRKIIADHMVNSKKTAPHVCSFVEVDVTNLSNWRKANKDAFLKKYNTKLTFTPLIIEAITKVIRDYPVINSSVSGDNIIYKKDINIGMAAALPNGNLIVPVIKNADRKNLAGIADSVNDLATKARAGQLNPDDIQNGTFTFTNIGMFNNIIGTPIIPQPQVAILAAGVIKKRPMVLETEQGDVIAIRQMMYLSMSYDHRVVDGYVGGTFLNAVGQQLENFDVNRKI